MINSQSRCRIKVLRVFGKGSSSGRSTTIHIASICKTALARTPTMQPLIVRCLTQFHAHIHCLLHCFLWMCCCCCCCCCAAHTLYTKKYIFQFSRAIESIKRAATKAASVTSRQDCVRQLLL